MGTSAPSFAAPRVGLALSGGGFRATLFGLGSLWRINEAGLLQGLARISSVSGGSIVAGVLAHRWSRLQFVQGRALNLETELVQPVRDFCSHSIDIGTALMGMLTPFKTAGDFLADRYAKDLFGETLMHELPPAAPGRVPRFVFYATNLQTGRSFRFRQDFIADYVLGLSRHTPVRLATAVAASSAFPPIFSPVLLHTDPGHWVDALSTRADLDKLRKRIVLADGGIYDNMGLETLVGKVDVVLASDAGAPFEVDPSPPEDNVRQLGRVRDILIDQTRALRKRWLVAELEAGRMRGAYWGIGTAINEYQAPRALVADNDTTEALQAVPTRLNRFEPELQGRLINWGYALADAALRTRAGLALPPGAGWPVPDAAL